MARKVATVYSHSGTTLVLQTYNLFAAPIALTIDSRTYTALRANPVTIDDDNIGLEVLLKTAGTKLSQGTAVYVADDADILPLAKTEDVLEVANPAALKAITFDLRPDEQVRTVLKSAGGEKVYYLYQYLAYLTYESDPGWETAIKPTDSNGKGQGDEDGTYKDGWWKRTEGWGGASGPVGELAWVSADKYDRYPGVLADKVLANHGITVNAAIHKMYVEYGDIPHNDLKSLNAGDYQHLTATQDSGLTGAGNTSLHKHDNMYYTEVELNAGQLDTRYYTETELNAGQLDTRYYTEAEIDILAATIGQDKTGWARDIQNDIVLSFDDGNMRLTVTGAEDYYIEDVKYTVTSPDTVDLDGTEGLWYIYYTGSMLTASQVAWHVRDNDKALVSIIYWDATHGTANYLQWEMHSWDYSATVHDEFHDTLRTMFASGFGIADNADGTLDLSIGTLYDEDIEIVTIDGAGAGMWEQPHTPIEAPVFYLDGAGADVRMAYNDTSNTYICLQDGSDNPYWNEFTEGAWKNTPTGNNKYMAMWLFATPCLLHPLMWLTGQAAPTVKLVDAVNNNGIDSISWADLPFEEIKVLYRIIIKNTGAPYTVSQIDDFRRVTGLPVSGGITQSHASLSDLMTSGHPAGVINVDETAFSGVLSATDTDVQTALETLDALVIGDLVDVTIGGSPAPYDNDILQWDEGNSVWVNHALATAGISAVGHIHDGRYYTETELDGGQLDNRYYTETEVDDHNWDAADITSGTLHDDRISESSVTQHEAALSIADSQINDWTVADGQYDVLGAAATAESNANSYTDTAVTNSGNWDDAYTHVSNNGTDHGYIDQDLQTSASPTFTGLDLAGGGLTNTGAIAGATTIDASGNVTITKTAANAYFEVYANAGQYKGLRFRTGAIPRWLFASDTVGETGSNAGSNMVIFRYADAGGAPLGTALAINRATGNAAFEAALDINGVLQGLTAGSTTGHAVEYDQARGWVVDRAKPDNEVVNNSVALQDDDDLTFSVPAGTTWNVKLILHLTTTAVADWKFNFNCPNCSMFGYGVVYQDVSGAKDASHLGPANDNLGNFFAPGEAASWPVVFDLRVKNTTESAETFKLQWAQDTAEATDTTVHQGSYLAATRVA